MASAPTVATEDIEIAVSLPASLLREIDETAASQGRTRNEVLPIAANYYIGSLRCRAIQAVVAPAFEAAGIRTEDDVEDLLDALPDATVR